MRTKNGVGTVPTPPVLSADLNRRLPTYLPATVVFASAAASSFGNDSVRFAPASTTTRFSSVIVLPSIAISARTS